MKEEILTLIQKGNYSDLHDYILLHCLDNGFYQSLHSNKELFKTIFFGVYGASLLNADAKKNYQKRQLSESILACIKLLVAYGLMPYRDHNEAKRLGYSVDIGCKLSNTMPNTSVCRQSYLLSCMTSAQLEKYWSYVKMVMPFHGKVIAEIEELKETYLQRKAYLRNIEKHIRNGTLLNYYKGHISKALITENSMVGVNTTLIGDMLSECTCFGHERETRNRLEQTLLKESQVRFPVADTARLNYLSLGSGNLLQDFIIILKLLRAGYKNITISLVEPNMRKLNFTLFGRLHDLGREVGATLNITHFFSIQHYELTNGEKLHLISGIDFENVFKETVFDDVMFTQSLLEPNGFFLFSYDEHKLGITKRSIIPLEVSAGAARFNPLFEQAVGELDPEKKVVTLAIIIPNFLMEQWLHFLPKFSDTSISTLNIVMLEPKKLNYFGAVQDTKNKGFTVENLERFFSLCLKGKKKVNVVLAKSENEFLQLKPDSGYDIVSQLGLTSNDLDGLYNKIDSIHTVYKESLVFSAAQYVTDYSCINIIKGDIRTLLSREDAGRRAKKLAEIFSSLEKICDKIKKNARQLTKAPTFLPDSYKKKKSQRLKLALKRGGHYVAENLPQSDNPTLRDAIMTLFNTRVDGQESLYETCHFNSNVLHDRSEIKISLAMFIKVNFNIDLKGGRYQLKRREAMKKQLFHLYYFGKYDDINVQKIDGNAIVFVDMPSNDQDNNVERTAYFVRNNQFFLDGDSGNIKTAVVFLSRKNIDSLTKNCQADGRVEIEDHPYDHCVMNLSRITRVLAKQEYFPYPHTRLRFSKDGKSLVSVYRSNMAGLIVERFNSDSNLNDIHPILKEYFQIKDQPSYNILTLLYKIKASPDFELCNDYWQYGGMPLGFGLTYGGSQQVTIDKMITAAHRAMGTKLMFFPDFEKNIEKISQQFKHSSLTPLKERTLNDFKTFYNSNKNNPALMPHSVLIRSWIDHFKENNNKQNPFSILNSQRRTGYLSIFNPKITNSTKLFYKLLAGEMIPRSLNNLMLARPSHQLSLSHTKSGECSSKYINKV